MRGKFLLINMYGTKSLGLQYIERALTDGGYDTRVLYFKSFHSARPQRPTEHELELLDDFVLDYKPDIIGFSVITSLYLDVLEPVSARLRALTSVPVIWGGVFATMMPEKCLDHCDYVIRGESEESIVEFAELIRSGTTPYNMQNLAYRDENGETVLNPLRPLVQDLDSLPVAKIGLPNKYRLDNNLLINRDPLLNSIAYEIACSRGCPFVCSYCAGVGLRRMYKGDKGYLRFSSPGKVIGELLEAKRKMKKLKLIHFWDEIFPDDMEWIEEFTDRYRREIGLPFTIWLHPKKTNPEIITKLRRAGLHKAGMGIQSGSPSLRKEIFHRAETQEEIISAAKTLSGSRVPMIYYDFILRHPFESLEQLKESYDLCASLPLPFSLNLHNLSFLPGTDISQMAIEKGYYSPRELESIMYAPIEEQYAAWWENFNSNDETMFWYRLIFLTQFRSLRPYAARLASEGFNPSNASKAEKYFNYGKKQLAARELQKKGVFYLTGYVGALTKRAK